MQTLDRRRKSSLYFTSTPGWPDLFGSHPGLFFTNVIRHARTGRHLRVIRPGRREPFVKRIGVEIMRLIGQRLPQFPADHHQALMRPIGLVGREQIDVRPQIANIRKPMRGVRYAVHADKCTSRVGNRSDLGDRVNLSHHIGTMRETDQTHFFVQHVFQILWVQ